MALTFYKGSVLEESHYYPFGLTLTSHAANPGEQNKYMLTTKELQEEHGLNWYDFGARMQDEQTGRWLQHDPSSEKYVSWTPYNFNLNNPVKLFDPNGKDPCCETAEQILTLKAEWEQNTMEFLGGPVDPLADGSWTAIELGFDVVAGATAAWEWFSESIPQAVVTPGPVTPIPQPLTPDAPTADIPIGVSSPGTPSANIPVSPTAPSSVQGNANNGLVTTDATNAAAQLPKLQGKTIPSIQNTLTKNGFSLSKRTSTGNETYDHSDGSQVRVHPYGNQNKTSYKSANNAHVHKQNPAADQLDDHGIISTNPNKTHIGVKNPADLPNVRGRGHGE